MHYYEKIYNLQINLKQDCDLEVWYGMVLVFSVADEGQRCQRTER